MRGPPFSRPWIARAGIVPWYARKGGGSALATDFGGYTTGIAAPDWTEQWNAADQNHTIEAKGGTISGKVLRLVNTTFAAKTLLWDEIPAGQDFEVLLKVSKPTQWESYDVMPVIRCSGDGSAKFAYAAYRPGQSSLLRVRFGSGDSGTSSETSLGSFTVESWAHGTPCWVRFRLSGGELGLKLWNEGSAEPGAFESTTIIGTVNPDGGVGVGAFRNGTLDFEWFSVGLNGDTAPSPP